MFSLSHTYPHTQSHNYTHCHKHTHTYTHCHTQIVRVGCISTNYVARHFALYLIIGLCFLTATGSAASPKFPNNIQSFNSARIVCDLFVCLFVCSYALWNLYCFHLLIDFLVCFNGGRVSSYSQSNSFPSPIREIFGFLYILKQSDQNKK